MISILNTLYSTVTRAGAPLVDRIFAALKGRSQFFENETSSKAQAQVLDDAGVLGKASLLITPTAYNTGKLNAVLPSDSPFGDFNKAGGTNATRINSSGYVEDISSSYPRIDYEDGSTGVLCEYQTTNLLRYSESISAGSGSPWTTSGMGSSPVLMTLPDGSVGNVNNNYVYGGSGGFTQTVSNIINKGVGVSVWAFNPETTAHDFTISITGYPSAPTVISLPPLVWTRCKAITAAASTSSYTGIAFTLAPGKSTRLWGAQLEQSQFLTRQGVVTSYIPTTSTALTRVGELLVGPVTTEQINSEEGVLLFEGKMTNSGTNEFINILGIGGISSNSLAMYGTGGGTISGRMIVGGAQQYFAVGGATLKVNYNKVAIKWDGTTIKTFINGTIVTNVAQNNAFSAGDLNQVHLSTGQRFYGKLKMIGVFNEALTDAEVIAITT
jgi:hypothetical protein